MGKQTKTITKSYITDSRTISYGRFPFFLFFHFFHKFTKSGKTMNAPLLLSILIALVCAELACSLRSKSLAKEKVGEMSNKIKEALQEDADARSLLYRLKYYVSDYPGCVKSGPCKHNRDCCSAD